MSFNYHKDHFGETWGLHNAKGEVLHTGCVAFGMDRLAVALFVTHGAEDQRLAGQRARRRSEALGGIARRPRHHRAGDVSAPRPPSDTPPSRPRPRLPPGGAGRRATAILSRWPVAMPRVISVSMKPGATALTVMPSRPTSRARLRVKPSIAGLGRAIDRQAAIAGRGDDRADIDDAPLARRHHAAHDIFGQHDRRHGVQPDQLFDLGIVHVGEQALRAQRGVVDQAVKGAVLGLHLAHQIGDHVRPASGRKARNSARRRDVRRSPWSDPRFPCGPGRRRDSRQPPAVGHRQADAAGTAGDQHVTHGGSAFRPRSIPARARSAAWRAPCRPAASARQASMMASLKLALSLAAIGQHDLGHDHRAGDGVLAARHARQRARRDGG